MDIFRLCLELAPFYSLVDVHNLTLTIVRNSQIWKYRAFKEIFSDSLLLIRTIQLGLISTSLRELSFVYILLHYIYEVSHLLKFKKLQNTICS